jgi:hypothetical protein
MFTENFKCFPENFKCSHLEGAVNQREGVLDRHRARHAQLVGDPPKLAHAEGGLIAQAVVLDLAIV